MQRSSIVAGFREGDAVPFVWQLAAANGHLIRNSVNRVDNQGQIHDRVATVDGLQDDVGILASCVDIRAMVVVRQFALTNRDFIRDIVRRKRGHGDGGGKLVAGGGGNRHGVRTGRNNNLSFVSAEVPFESGLHIGGGGQRGGSLRTDEGVAGDSHV